MYIGHIILEDLIYGVCVVQGKLNHTNRPKIEDYFEIPGHQTWFIFILVIEKLFLLYLCEASDIL